MTHKENIKAVLECYFTGYKEEIINSACSRILELRPKTGHWIMVRPLQEDDDGAYLCSECKMGEWGNIGEWKFCPNCGAKMIEIQKRSSKE